ncbi:hypothetical protein GGI43DRAFT_394715, partial [Trichoderma evansii]
LLLLSLNTHIFAPLLWPFKWHLLQVGNCFFNCFSGCFSGLSSCLSSCFSSCFSSCSSSSGSSSSGFSGSCCSTSSTIFYNVD